MMDKGLCIFCHLTPVTGRNRKYCKEHSRLASTLWKRRHRRIWKLAGDQYWLIDWKNKAPEERRAYFRAYMRQYRASKGSLVISAVDSSLPGEPPVKTHNSPGSDGVSELHSPPPPSPGIPIVTRVINESAR